MNQTRTHECTNCGELLTLEVRNHRYVESGLTNVILQGALVAECPRCGNEDLMLPRLIAIHEAIASALVNSPARLTGPQLKFLRKHLELSDEELGKYLHTGKAEVSAWEREQTPIEPSADHLIRMLAAALDREMTPAITAVAHHLPEISDRSGSEYELHINLATMQAAFVSLYRAA